MASETVCVTAAPPENASAGAVWTPPAPAAPAPPQGRIADRQSLQSVTPHRFLARLRWQLGLGLLLTAVVPSFLYAYTQPSLIWTLPSGVNTLIASAVALVIGLALFRRAGTYPGISIVGRVLPSTAASYGLLAAIFLLFRLDYSRLTFLFSFLAANIFFFLVSSYLRSRPGQLFYVIPSDSTKTVSAVPDIDWVMLESAELPSDRNAVLIADLRADLDEKWERLIANATLAGHTVLHIKQVTESLTGRVEINHLSENSFGSLIPNSAYGKVKRACDLGIALIAVPVLALPLLLVALIIRLDSPGPVFFRQARRGYRGEVFRVLKFRTMRETPAFATEMDEAITRAGDERITRFGRLLRRTRIDELPQIWNIIRGEMSWIGPRPEALALSEWYAGELPFYTYRHIVRPGITGWAQVHQGHVADLGSVHEKLQYDFYYIKNFSAWLDLIIASKTVTTVIFGFGAK
jgi:lipopolysaccharide/colanic/teichoic acid biosynthesis glycosyltransferase